MKLRVLLWWALRIGTAIVAAANLAFLAQHPFAEPFVERTAAGARLALDRALGERLTPGWVAAELDAAVQSEDLDRAELLLDLVESRRIPVPGDRIAGAREFVDRKNQPLARLQRCSACLMDAADCRTPSMLFACNIPVELTVVGDVKALAEAGADAVADRQVDRVGVALAAAGIGATALVPLTGGTSLTIKAGATTLRLARKMGVLGKGISRALSDAANAPFRWNRLGEFARTGRLDAITDARRFRKLGRIADDLGAVGKHAGPAEAIFLLKHVETAKDAAVLARVSRIAGKKTRRTMEVLGLGRAARALVRLSDLAWTALGLLAALAAQALALLSPLCLRPLRRALRPAPARAGALVS